MTSGQDASFGALRSGVKEFIPASSRAPAPAPPQPSAPPQSSSSSFSAKAREFVPPSRSLTPPAAPQQAPPLRVFIPGHGLAHAGEAEPQHMLLRASEFELPRLEPRALERAPRRRTARSALLPDDLRSYFAAQARVLYLSQPADDPMIKELPRKFHSFHCLDDPQLSARSVSGSLGYPSAVFKAVNAKDGCVYAVRRVDNTRASGNLGAVQAMWARVSNANVLPLREAFVQNRALFLVHDFCPGAQTLKEFVAARGPGQLLPESALWAVATQLLSAVRAVHGAGLGSCVVGPSKVLLTGRYRARLSSAGLVHALEPAATAAAGLQEQQQEDILWVGKLVVMLATMNLGALANLALSVEHMKAVYSPELVAFALHAFKAQHEGRRCNVYDLLALASQALLAENDSLYAHGDALEETLARVYEADRLFRLMTKLSVVTERPPLPGQKPGDSWSETDDRYLIKLFRDYCFHQTDDADRPWLDLGHIVDCLNKLDVGSPERILLSSRDGRSFLVVSFDEIRLCVERSFQELLLSNPDHAAAMPPPPDP